MKATLDADGKLTVIPENDVEAYALKHWMAAFSNLQSAQRPVLSVGEKTMNSVSPG